MSYSEDGDTVILTMSRDDYGSILLALGMATGLASKEGRDISPWISLVNRINQGNPVGKLF